MHTSSVNSSSYSESSRRPLWAKILIVLLVLVVVLILAIAGLAFGGRYWLRQAMRDSLPQLDGQITVASLKGPVTVQRDGHGIPVITAGSLDDLFVAQGYVTAQDRLWQMDMSRRFAFGELSELLGKLPLEHDRTQRYLQIRQAAEAILAAAAPRDRQYMEDYARGVNEFIDSHKDRLPAEFRLLHYEPARWQALDSVGVVLNMHQMLAEDFTTKLGREVLAAKLTPEQMADLYPVGSWRDHPPMAVAPDLTAPQENIPDVPLDESQTKLERLKLEDLRKLHELIHAGNGDDCGDCRAGSNEWVVSGLHTETGKPLLSNDMHLGHNIPNIWYEAHLKCVGGADCKELDVAGVTLPGVPYVTEGHNAHIAWGFTNLGGDVQDVYVEELNEKDEYKTAEGWKPLDISRETIHVRGGQDVVLNVRRTAHGPIISPLLGHEKRALALKWVVYDPAAVPLSLLDVNQAANWQEFSAAMAGFGGPTQNVAYADVEGNIGYHGAGKMPNRPAGLVGVPITDANHEWSGLIPFEQMPSVLNPPAGIIATANARVTPDGYMPQMTLNWADPYRNERIWKVLGGKPKFTSADMLALQTDTYSEVDLELGQRFAYAIDHAKKANARLHAAADLMRSWDGNVGADLAAPAIVDAARKALWRLVLEPKLGEHWDEYVWGEKTFVQEEMVLHAPARWLPPGYASWDDLLAAAVEKGLEEEHAPGDLKGWRYGAAHPVEIEHPLYGLIPGLKAWTGTGVHPQSGDHTTVKQVGRTFGPSERLTADMSDLDKTTHNIVLGESGNPLSPYYMDQWPYWYGGQTFVLPFSDAAVKAATQHELKLVP